MAFACLLVDEGLRLATDSGLRNGELRWQRTKLALRCVARTSRVGSFVHCHCNLDVAGI